MRVCFPVGSVVRLSSEKIFGEVSSAKSFLAAAVRSLPDKPTSLRRVRGNFSTIDEFLQLGDTVTKIHSSCTTRKPKQQDPIFERIAWQPATDAVVFMYDRSIVFSAIDISSALKSIPILPLMFRWKPLCQIFFVASNKFVKQMNLIYLL